MRNKRFISILLTLCMALSLLPTTALAASADRFTDVAKDSWYYEDVSFVVDEGYFKGMSDTIFAPDETMTRAMFVTVMARYAGVKLDDSTSTFTDVPAGEWYTGAVAWAAKKGIVNGRGNGIFDPNGAVTREEMCTILDRYLEAYDESAKLTKNPAEITDLATVSAYATEAVENCVAYGVIIGYPDGTFQPKTTATRAHVAAILNRLVLKVSGGGGGGGGSSTTDLVWNAATATVKYINENVDEWAPETDAVVIDTVEATKSTKTIEAKAALTADKTYADIALGYALDAAALVYADVANDAPGTKQALKEIVVEVAGKLGYELDAQAEWNVDAAVDAAVEKAQGLREGLRTALQTYEVQDDVYDYAFDKVHVLSGETELFVIDVTDGFDKQSIDLPAGVTSKRAAAKTAALAVASQLNESVKAHTDESEDLVVSAALVLTFDIKTAVAEDDDYDCTKKITVKLSADLSSDLMTHAYDAENDVHNVSVTVPEDYKAAYDAYMDKLIKKVAATLKAPAAETYALASAADVKAGFDFSNIDIDKYLTAEVVQALTNPNADQTAVYDVVDDVISNAVSAEQVNEALANSGMDSTLTDVVEVLADKNTNETFKKDLITEITTAAKDAVEEVLIEQGYEEIATEAFVDYAANTALNKVVQEEAAKITEAKKEEMGDDFDEEADAVVVEVFEKVAAEKKEEVIKQDAETGKSHMDKVVEVVVKEQPVVKETLQKVEENPFLKAATQVLTYESMSKQTFEGLANLLETSKYDSYGDVTIGNITAKLDEYKIFVPATANIKVGDAEITAEMLSALRDADNTTELREALIVICEALGDLCLADFADGEIITAAAGGYDVVVNLVID